MTIYTTNTPFEKKKQQQTNKRELNYYQRHQYRHEFCCC